MQINTKYNLGDKVWFIDDHEAHTGTIVGMAYTCSYIDKENAKQLSAIRYRVEPVYGDVEEKYCFPTKEELINSL